MAISGAVTLAAAPAFRQGHSVHGSARTPLRRSPLAYRVSPVRCPERGCLRRSLRVRSASSPPEGDSSDDSKFVVSTDWKGRFFGTYLVLGMWVTVLSFAGFTAYQKSQIDPTSVGLLGGPPAGAVLLILSFLVFKLFSNAQKQAKKQSKQQQE